MACQHAVSHEAARDNNRHENVLMGGGERQYSKSTVIRPKRRRKELFSPFLLRFVNEGMSLRQKGGGEIKQHGKGKKEKGE